MSCKIAMNGFLGRMGQSIFQESSNHNDVEITIGCDSNEKIKSSSEKFNLELTSDISKFDNLFDVVIDRFPVYDTPVLLLILALVIFFTVSGIIVGCETSKPKFL